jgi:mRNA interferase MazF
VLSPGRYNGRVGLALVCPITNQAKGYSFEVPLPEGLGVAGVALADQVKSFDWRARRASLIEPIPVEVLNEVLELALSLLDPEA